MDGVLEAKISMLESQIAALEARIDEATSVGPTYPVFEGMPGFGDGGAWTVEIEEEGVSKTIKVTNCCAYISRKLEEFDDFTVPASGGRVCVVIFHGSMTSVVQVTEDDSDDEKTVIPIFRIDSNGDITEDYRRIPFVQFYE